MSTLQGKRILLGITGSIAAYKAAFLTRLLVKAGAEVRVVMTPAATHFVSALTLSTLSKHTVHTEIMDEGQWNNHVDMGLWADRIVVAPATANTLAAMANGVCDNLLLAIIAAIPFQLGLLFPSFQSESLLPSLSFFLSEFIFINLILLFFNMIPVFPLDGEKVAEYFLPPSGQDTLLRLRPYGPMILMALLFLLPMANINIVTYLVGWPANQIFRLLVL